MKSIHIIITLQAILILSCNKKEWLDIKPSQSLALPSSLQDCQALMDNTRILNSNMPSTGEEASDGHYVIDQSWNSMSPSEKNAYTWTLLNPTNNNSDWASIYEKVFYCNVVLEALSKITVDNSTSLTWNNIRGQALFTRAFCFFSLAQIFGQPFNSNSASIDLGIPLRLESDLNIRTSRNTVAETYDQIINDLLIAKDLLPTTPVYKTRASKPAVYALLARIFLSIGEYQKSLLNSTNCLQLYKNLMNYDNDPEIISSDANPFARLNKEIIYQTNLLSSNSIGALALIDTSLYSLYNINDKRRTLFFRNNTNGTISFKGSYYRSSTPFAGLAVDEVYLIRAECYAREGNAIQALFDLNTLLEKRYNSSFVPYTAANADQALNLILLERRKELLFRGIRWIDLRRLNKDNRFKIELKRRILNKDYTLEPNSLKYTFSIPEDIVSSTNIQQNPGW